MIEQIITYVISGGATSLITYFAFWKFTKKKAALDVEDTEEVVEGKKIDNFVKMQAVYQTLFDQLNKMHDQRQITQDEKLSLMQEKQDFMLEKVKRIEKTLVEVYDSINTCPHSETCETVKILKRIKK